MPGLSFNHIMKNSLGRAANQAESVYSVTASPIMARELMRRKASDNAYLHKDFHGALSTGLEYLHRNHGQQAVKDFLRQFALTFYSPLRNALKQRGLIALKEHFEKIYRDEGGKIEIEFSKDQMILKVKSCPAVMHMREHGYPVASLFHETTKTVNQAICEDSDFAAELLSYQPQTGASVQRFSRRAK